LYGPFALFHFKPDIASEGTVMSGISENSDLIKIKIKNWRKYNPQEKGKQANWFRVEQDIFSNPRIAPLSQAQKLLWFYILCEANRASNKRILDLRLSPNGFSAADEIEVALSSYMVSFFVGIKESELASHITHMQKVGLIQIVGDYAEGSWPVRDRPGPDRDRTETVLGPSYETIRNGTERTKKEIVLVEELGSSRRNESEESRPPAASQVHPHKIFRVYNQICADNFARCLKLDRDREAQIQQLSKNLLPTLDDWANFFRRACKSRWLNGENPTSWRPDLDWFIQEKNALKLLEGKFDNREKVVCTAMSSFLDKFGLRGLGHEHE
jgi:hypothetical protein